MAGGKGGVSGTANVVPELVISVYNHWESGNLKEAEMAQMLMKPMLDAYQFSTLPSVYKEALHMMGMAVGPSRMPVGPLSEDQKDRLFAILTDYAIQKFIDKDTLKRVKAISGS
jgi:4-hydroxy-tetrahydrodipicolinate synthase